MKQILAWVHCREGATGVEYGLLAGGISLAVVATVLIFGSDLRGIFTSLDSSFAPITASPTG